MTDTPISVGKDAYNPFTQYARYSYNCISYLMNNNQLVWKLLKHAHPEAWNEPDLSQEEKAALIYKGQENAAISAVFLDIKQPDVFTTEAAILRISPYFAVGLNRTVGIVEISMEIFCHYKINHLSNYQTRVDTIVGELLATFNGADIGGLGLLHFNKLADQNSKMILAGQIPFGGKQVIFTNNSA
jgi:hypothetical protein